MTEATQAPANALATFLNAKKASLTTALPKGMDWAPWQAGVLAAAASEPNIVKCVTENPVSVAKVCIEAAMLGLVPGPGLGQVFFIPRRMSQKLPDGSWSPKRWTLTTIIGYQGMLDLAYRHERVELLQPELVYRDDDFTYTPSDLEEPVHHVQPLDGDRSDSAVVGAYCLAVLRGSRRPVVVVMNRDELDAVAADAGGNVWADNFRAMCRKTVIRRITSRIPKSTALQQALQGESDRWVVAREQEQEQPQGTVQAVVRENEAEIRDAVKNRPDREQEPEDENPGGGVDSSDSLTGDRPPETWRTKSNRRPKNAKAGDRWHSEASGEWKELGQDGEWRLIDNPEPAPAVPTVELMQPVVQDGLPDEAPDREVAFFNLHVGKVFTFTPDGDEYQECGSDSGPYQQVAAAIAAAYKKETGEEPGKLTLGEQAKAIVPF